MSDVVLILLYLVGWIVTGVLMKKVPNDMGIRDCATFLSFFWPITLPMVFVELAIRGILKLFKWDEDENDENIFEDGDEPLDN